MNTTYSLYCDETGMFSARDIHVIHPLIVRDNSLQPEQVEDFWKRALQGKNWRSFHAVHSPKDSIERIANLFWTELNDSSKVFSAYVYHKNEQSYGFDFYPAMLVKLVIWFCRNILGQTAASLKSQMEKEPLHVHVDLYLAFRQQLNNLYLAQYLHDRMKTSVQQKLKKTGLAPDRISFQFNPYTQPISGSPYLQISDLLCYTTRGYLNGFPYEEKAAERHGQIPARELKQDEIESNGTRRLCRDILTPVVKEVVQTKEKVVTKILPGPVKIVSRESQSQIMDLVIDRFKSLTAYSDKPDYTKLQPLLDKLMKMPPERRALEFEVLYQHAFHATREKRDYVTSALAVDLIYHLLDDETFRDKTETWRKTQEFRAADLYLTINNHLGYFLCDDPRIRRAISLSEELQTDMTLWGAICSFHNHLAVALQNAFYFDDAVKYLYPRVQSFEAQKQNPFTGGNLRAYEFGALFGNYAQSLAFSAHCRFFSEGEGALKDLEDAEIYSILSEEHLEKEKDRERQATYRAHFKMQRYVLLGDQDALDEAGSLLEGEPSEKAIQYFIRAFPAKESLTPAYRVHALLKYSFLSRKGPEWLLPVIRAVLDKRKQLPGDHPMEQVIPYLAILAPESERNELMGSLSRVSFPQNIVDTIRLVMLAQIEFIEHGALSEKTIQGIAKSVEIGIRPQWDRYRLGEVLSGYTAKGPNRWHIGPMEILPFNYA